MIFKISKLKIIEIRQRNAFSIKNGMFLIYYIANLNFPGIPGKFPEYFGNSRSREIEIVREIPNPIVFGHTAKVDVVKVITFIVAMRAALLSLTLIMIYNSSLVLHTFSFMVFAI